MNIFQNQNFQNFCLIFKGRPLKTKNATSTSRDLNSDFTLKDCLFGGVKLAENADPDKYVYSGHGIRFDSRSECSSPDGGISKNVIIFEVDMSSSVHIDNKIKYILILDKDPVQG